MGYSEAEGKSFIMKTTRKGNEVKNKEKMTRSKRLAVTVASLSAITLVLSACSSSDTATDTSESAAATQSTESASEEAAADTTPIKVGVLTDLTGAFGIVGQSNQAVAQFTIDEINANGGILGRPVELVVVDSASDPAVGATVASKLVNEDQVDVVIGGVASNMREAIKDIIATRGDTTYIWPASYEGKECTPNVWSVGAVPNQQVDPVVQKLLDEGNKTFFLAGNDYLYPREVLAQVRTVVEAGGGEIVGEEYVPLDITDTSSLVSKIIASEADVLFEIVVLPATAPFIQGLVDGGYKGEIVGTLFDEAINGIIGTQADGLLGIQDYFATIDDEFSKTKVAEFQAAFPDQAGLFTATFNAPAWYRGLYLWKTAVEAAGTTDTAAVETAMDSVSYDALIGGPARMVPGTRHAELTMYLGRMNADTSVTIVEPLGVVTPEQCG